MLDEGSWFAAVSLDSLRACRDSKGGLKTAFGLCQRMMHFFQQYLLYVTFEVLEPYWLALHKAVRESKSLDEVSSQNLPVFVSKFKPHQRA